MYQKYRRHVLESCKPTLPSSPFPPALLCLSSVLHTPLSSSGIAGAYLSVLTGDDMPHPLSEFLVAVPQVLGALCLTSAGAEAVSSHEVFPSVRRCRAYNYTAVITSPLQARVLCTCGSCCGSIAKKENLR